MTDYTSEENYLSGAPEGYELICVEYFGEPSPAFRDREYLIGSSGALIRRTGNQMRMYRPIEKPWTGDGLPPVGTECDCRVKAGAEWVPCVIVAHHKHYAIAYVDDDTVMLSCGIRFRPRRTPAQIAADERKASIESMIAACPYPGSNSTAIDCAALYDAGLRFPKGDDQ